MNRETIELHDQYENTHYYIRQAINEAADLVMATFEKHGLKAAKDDRAEEMVAALMRYHLASKR